MANSVGITQLDRGVQLVTASFSQNGNLDFRVPSLQGMAITLVRTTGTFDLQGSADGVNYAALPTAVSMTAAGNYLANQANAGFLHYRLAGSATAVGTVYIVCSHAALA
jgi:hypothetical protein